MSSKKAPRKNTKNFVNNPEFLELLHDYKRTGVISERLGEIFILMTNKLIISGNFVNYTEDWKQEMKSDAIYNCCRYVGTFDTNIGTNPFAYFTSTIIRSFLMRMKKEKKMDGNEKEVKMQMYNSFLDAYGMSHNSGNDNNYNGD